MVQRRTDKALPRYLDHHGSDTFVLSEVEELVPVGASRSAGGYAIQRYQPRTEGGFALIERWTDAAGLAHWRTRDGSNVSRTYGASSGARLADPANASRIFAWHLEEEWDELGNGVRYVYDLVTGATPGSGVAERNRSIASLYLKRVQYANKTPNTFSGGWYFEAVLDYGEHDATDPGLEPEPGVVPVVRADSFSRFRAGFDVRCHRLCERLLVFHRFSPGTGNDGQGSAATVVRSLDFTYDQNAVASTLSSVQLTGWAADLSTLSLPALQMSYVARSTASGPAFLDGIDDIPNGIDFSRAQWVDLDGEGLTGLLTEVGGAWWYKRNEGAGLLGAWRRLPSRPGLGLGAVQLGDVDGDGRLEVTVRVPGLAGTWTRDADGEWEGFRSFKQVPQVLQDGGNTRMVDVDGDGRADLVVATATGLLVFRSDGLDGWLAPDRVARAMDEADGPTLLFANAQESLMLADMSGDGLVDLVRVRHHEVSYWPNLGYGRFGGRIQMAGPPLFDRPDRFDARRVRLADIDGAGPADLLYVGPDRVRWWSNRSGNGFGDEQLVPGVPGIADPVTVTVADLLGDGTACLVWASPLLRDRHAPIRYIKLMQGGKPYLLNAFDNGLGRTNSFAYTPSTAFYIADRRSGTPWATRLSFPVQCLTRVTTADAVTGWSNTTTYAYHHGYFDPAEREFRGFGKVEQWDTEATTDGDLAPVRTVTWFHTGAWNATERSLTDTYRTEYFAGDGTAFSAPENTFEGALSTREKREAHRALKGRPLRQEVYAEDGSADEGTPYVVTQSTWTVRKLQDTDGVTPGVFLVLAQQSVTSHYERDTDDPRVVQQVTLEADDYGVVTRSATVAYPRRGSGNPSEQASGVVLVAEQMVTHDDTSTSQRHIGVPHRAKSWHLGSVSPTTTLLTAAALDAGFDAAVALAWDEAVPGSGGWRRLLADKITTYTADDGTQMAPGAALQSRALPYQAYAQVFTDDQAADLLAMPGPTLDLADAGYVELGSEAGWWAASGTQTRDGSHFYVPTTITDPFGGVTSVTWHGSYLFPEAIDDALENTTAAEYDLRALSPATVIDPNGDEVQVSFDALGRPVAMAAVGNAAEGDTLASPTAEFEYHVNEVPAWSWGRVRETHGVAAASTRWIETITYADGAGNAVMTKVTAAPDPSTPTTARWVGAGRVVLNNKGLPIKQYQPFFSSTDAFEAEEGFSGVTPILTYDALGRVIRVDLPDGNVRRVEFDPWRQVTYDENDTTVGHDHENTPTTVLLDVQGRVYATEELLTAGGTPLTTALELDVVGNPLTVTDPRGTVVQTQTVDMLGRHLSSTSPDAGNVTGLLDVAGQPLFLWKSGNLGIEAEHDLLRRRVRTWEWDTAGSTKVLRERFVYGEALDDPGTYDPAVDHLRGRVYRCYDTAGALELSYDFAGNVRTTTRRFFDDAEEDIDWSPFDPVGYPFTGDDTGSVAELEAGDGGSNPGAVSVLETEDFAVIDTFDAMKRPVMRTAPDGQETTFSYDDGGHLTGVDVDSSVFLAAVQYDARGQRASVEYGNGITTEYSYDPDTLRLATLASTRTSDSKVLQDLGYSYDPTGNVTAISNGAEDTLFFSNAAVTPDQEFEYDAVYRLTNAWGREKSSRGRADWSEPAYGSSIPDASETMQAYEQRYTYDDGGNITEMRHLLSGTTDWVRTYAYASTSNRLSTTTESAGTVGYQHDVRGSIVFWPHLYNDGATPNPTPNVQTDFRDQMRRALTSSSTSAVYHYDHAGQRARKVILTGSTVSAERRYVAGWERYYEKQTGTNYLERTTLHVMDGARRIAMIDTKTHDGANTTSVVVVRYQLENHLGTSVLEVDEAGAVISYEEFHPYGTCAWWTGDGGTDVSERRYRYCGMERDEETGLASHGVRYYAAWLGRWGSSDPIGIAGGANGYNYCASNPVLLSDTNGRKPRKPEAAAAAAPAAPSPPPAAAASPAGPPPAPPHAMPALAPAPALPTNVSVAAVPYRGLEEMSPRDVDRAFEVTAPGGLEPDDARHKVLKIAQEVGEDKSVFSASRAPTVTGRLTPISGDTYALSVTIGVDPNSVIRYEEPGSFGYSDPDADMRIGSTQDLTQGHFGTTQRQYERSHADVAQYTGTVEFAANVVAGSYSFTAKAPGQPMISTAPASFEGQAVAVQGAVTIPMTVTIRGTNGDVNLALPKLQASVLLPLQAYLGEVTTQVLYLSGHGEDYQSPEERGYDSQGTPIAFPPPPRLPDRF
jgi:RHS repeat-associated protein